MRITQQTDYAFRIVYLLAKSKNRVGAKQISALCSVPSRFCIKILQKLNQNGIVHSYKGANGGYALGRPGADISLKDIIEAVEGPVELHRCLNGGYECSGSGKKEECRFHLIFEKLNGDIVSKLSALNVGMIADEHVKIDDILKLI